MCPNFGGSRCNFRKSDFDCRRLLPRPPLLSGSGGGFLLKSPESPPGLQHRYRAGPSDGGVTFVRYPQGSASLSTGCRQANASINGFQRIGSAGIFIAGFYYLCLALVIRERSLTVETKRRLTADLVQFLNCVIR